MLLVPAVVLASACSDGGGPADSGADTTPDTAFDQCTTYPGTCNMDPRTPHAPWDCCPSGRECCPLCDGPDSCNLDYECRDGCPEVLPCTGTPGSGGLACWYDPADFTGLTAYCLVPVPMPESGTGECSSSCSTGVECPFPAATFGDASLCCPATATCGSSGFGLPYCQ